MTDIFEEVSAELRRDRMSAAWDKYGRYVIGLAAAIIALTAITIGASGYQKSQNEAASKRYDAMLAELTTMDEAARSARLAAFGEAESNGYGVLARFAFAHARLDAGDTEAALAAFDALADTGSVPDGMRDYANLQAAILLLDNAGAKADIRDRLDDLLDDGNGLQPIARETMALTHMRDDEPLEARQLFQAQIADPNASSFARQRAEIMLDKLAQALSPAESVNIDEGVSE